ncbi:MAG TPA: pitrilysin family protein [Terriglobales bacterium]|nr:pitrilysin family protein [Terriglobales bacterium]
MVPARFRCAAALALVLATAAFAQPPRPAPKFFPYPVESKTLPNGLSIVVIPTPEFRGMVTYATAVFAGSRNETQAGKTGLAHLFEHIMFLHQYQGQPGGYEQAMRRMGAFNNAFTDYDLTFYHPTTFTSNLVGPVQGLEGPGPGLIQLEASRFENLKLDRKTFQVEAGAVLGEYRRIYSDPGEKMIEEMSPVAFPRHPYGHTVIGYEKDVENMPHAWDAAWEFYGNYYKPNNVALVVVGDVEPKAIFAEVEKHYSDWKPSHPPQIPSEQLPQGPKDVHVNWDADVSPRLVVGYHTPAMRPGDKETAITMVLPELLVSRSAPLFQKLRYQKQTVTSFSILDGAELLQSTDPHLLLLDSELMLDRFRKEGQPYVTQVQNDVIAGVDALQHFSSQPGSAHVLKVVKSKVRNDFLAELDSTYDIAQTFAWYYRFNRDPNAIDALMQAIDSLAPRDIDAYAQKYFTRQGRIVTTLWHGPAPGAFSSAPASGEK